MRYAIKKIPNDPNVRAKVEATLPQGVKATKRRGRGFRRGCRYLHQSLPLNLAAYYTLYCAEESDYQRTPWDTKRLATYGIQQMTFRGFRNAKPVFRFERNGHVASPYQLSV